LMTYLPDAEALFTVPRDDYRAPDGPTMVDFTPRLAKWPPFRLRNVATLLQDQLEDLGGPVVWLNATVVGFQLDAAGHVNKLTAREPSGGVLSVSAKTTTLAAGAIESTRLLLLLDAQHENRIFAPDGVLGRFFYDHLSAPIASIVPEDASAFSNIFGFRFNGRALRSLRYELNGLSRRREKLPGAFLHISAIANDRSGFAALRDIFRKVQRRATPSLQDLSHLSVDAGWLARAVWWRFAKGRLLFPAGAAFELHQVIEQIPDFNNRISLSADRTDAYGLPLATIDWRVNQSDVDNFHRISALFLSNWNASALVRIAEAHGRAQSETESALTGGGGIYHPGGSVRIGITPQEGVIDGDLKVHRIQNLRVVSTAAFPRGGTANPTLMLILFALRAADQIHAELR
jgi:choline dehydrogenase-like flavoprotein